MKRFVFSIMLLSTIIFCAMAKDKGDVCVVYIGNSITQGVLLADSQNEAPPVKASEYLSEKIGSKVDFRNCGMSGATTLDFLPVTDRLFKNVINAANELTEKPSTLIFSVSLGTNDSACSGPFGSPVVPQQYYTNLKVIIDELLSSYPGSKVVVQYPLWYSPNTYNGSVYLKAGLERLQSYVPMIDKLVEDYSQSHKGRVFAGSREAFDLFRAHVDEYYVHEQGNAGEFYLHPNKLGAEKLGAIWCDGLIKAVTK